MNSIGRSRTADVHKANKEIEKAKRDYESAKSRGDRKGMNAAHERAETARKEGGTIKETDKLRETKSEKKDKVRPENNRNDNRTAAKVEISKNARRANEIAQKNKEIDVEKKKYVEAQRRGDTKGMETAHKRAEQLRNEGGTIKASDPSKERRAYETTKKNREIEKAKQDYTEAKRRGDTKGMEAAHQQAERLRQGAGTLRATDNGTAKSTPVNKAQAASQSTYDKWNKMTENAKNTAIHLGNEALQTAKNTATTIKNAAVETAKTTVAFTTGVMDAVSETATYNTYKGKVPSGYGNSYYGGKVVGNAAVTVGGAIETLAGGSLFGGGIVLDATGVGAIPGAAANVAGAAIATHGATVATTGAANLGKDAKNLYNNIAGKPSEGTGKAPVPTKPGGGSNPKNFVNPHSEKHLYDPSKPSTPNRSQYGKDVDVEKLRQETMTNPDKAFSNWPNPNNPNPNRITKYYKEFDGNISTPDTTTRSHRIFEHLDDPTRSSHFPYVPRNKE